MIAAYGHYIENVGTDDLEVLIVPNGTPHWFKEVPARMTYYVVKVRASGDSR